MNKQNLFPYLLLFIQPIFMASNLIVARGGVELIPPISLAFWRWFFVFLILLSFTFLSIKREIKIIKKEIWETFIFRLNGLWCVWGLPFYSWKNNYDN